MLSYSVRLSTNYDGMVLATIPDVPEARALGRDDQEAVEQALFALEATLERYLEQGLAPPCARAGGSLRVTTQRFGEFVAA